MYNLHDFQSNGVNLAIESQEQYHLLASPTGTGKSYMGLSLKHAIPDSYFITPRVEILADMCRKLGYNFETESQLLAICDRERMITPIRLRNRMINGEELDISTVILDECHHESADTYQQISAMVDKKTRYIGLTATPYRGTPKQTAKFRERWGEPNWAITYPKAVEQGYLSLPVCETWGLVDDDLIELSSNGEFVQSTLCAEVSNSLEHALIRACDAGLFAKSGKPARPMIIGVPSSAVFPQLMLEANLLSLRIATIDQSTSYKERQRLFNGVKECSFALAHINTISEGVDLPIRQYLDLSPVMSPVAFMQRFGRATRPITKDEQLPRYICTNHNIERHGYLLDGLLPTHVFREAQTAFNKPSERSGKTRVFGIESLGRIKGNTVRTAGGLLCTIYGITNMVGHRVHKYLVVLHPSYSSPLWFEREDTRNADGTNFGKYRIEHNPPSDVKGFKSLPSSGLSEAQLGRWTRNVTKTGLDPNQDVTPKVFELMNALLNVGASL